MVKCLVFLSLFSTERICVLYCFMDSRKRLYVMIKKFSNYFMPDMNNSSAM